MEDEIIEVYDENMHKIGTMQRSKAHETGAWHRSIHCWIVSGLDGGKVLFQKRGRYKKLFPNYLDITAAGHYIAGEHAREGVREILEELGIRVDFSELIPLGIKFDIAKIDQVVNREFCDVFLLKRDIKPHDYTPDPEEVEGLVEIDLADGLKLFTNEVKKITAQGIEWDVTNKKWNNIKIDVGLDVMIPRIDPYYLKVFIMARSLLLGEKYLSI